MRSLLFLSFLKIKGAVRNQFRTPASALITILLILLYGGLVIMAFAASSDNPMAKGTLDTNSALLIGIGMTALFAFTVMLNKRKALVFDTDAYYLFAGPYTRKQVNGYIMLQSLRQGVLYSLLGCYMIAMFSMTGYFTIPYFLVCFVVLTLMLFFFLLLTDYIYMWGLVDAKYKKWNYLPLAVAVVCTALVFFWSVYQSNYDLKNGFFIFAASREFYLVPFFGWAKWAIDGYLHSQYLFTLGGTGLLLACCLIIVVFFLRFNKDITEQAVADAEEASAFLRRAKENGGRARIEDGKVKRVKGEFAPGAKAILSKNMLIMRKTGNFLRKQDAAVIVMYFVISLIVLPDNVFYMFCYMMIIWLFTLIQDSDLLRDLNNYQIYLIPDSPLKKLVYAMIPAYLKIGIIMSVSVIFAGIFTRMAPLDIFQYLIMLLGYSLIFVAGTVLSVRILRSRANVMLESFLRMLIILVAAVPSLILGMLIILLTGMYREPALMMAVFTVSSLVMNILVSLVIIIACQGMMNGREV